MTLAGTETAHRVDRLDAGWVLDEPLVDTVTHLLQELTPEQYQGKREKLRALPISTFWEVDDLEHVCSQLLDLRTPDQGVVVGV